MRLAIADPPYPPSVSERFDTADGSPRLVSRSRARRWYGDGTRGPTDRPADFHPAAGEWDDPARHRALLEQLVAEFDGWAIATTPDGLDCYRPLPPAAQIMVWVKPTAMPTSRRVASTWEAVIVCPPPARRAREAVGTEATPTRRGAPATYVGRTFAPQVPDVLVCPPPTHGFAGAKPARWSRWVLDALGYDPDTDEVVDLFPGSGSVSAVIAQGVLL